MPVTSFFDTKDNAPYTSMEEPEKMQKVLEEVSRQLLWAQIRKRPIVGRR